MLDQTYMPSKYYGDNVAKPPKKSKKATQFEGTWKNKYGETIVFKGNTWQQTLPPMTGQNTGPNQIELKGTFMSDSETITIYSTDTSVDGGIWVDISAMGQSFIYRYSFIDNVMILELPWLFPETAYIKK
jgi:hypothetical protein